MTYEAAMLARAIHESRPLASVAGVSAASLQAARALARWAGAAGEPGLALAAWEGCAALDDTCASWLGVADVALSLGDASRAWSAAARVSVHPSSTGPERDRAHLVLARVCLLLSRPDEARAHLARISADPEPDVAAIARTLVGRVA